MRCAKTLRAVIHRPMPELTSLFQVLATMRLAFSCTHHPPAPEALPLRHDSFYIGFPL